jgi:hypothetical protein
MAQGQLLGQHTTGFVDVAFDRTLAQPEDSRDFRTRVALENRQDKARALPSRQLAHRVEDQLEFLLGGLGAVGSFRFRCRKKGHDIIQGELSAIALATTQTDPKADLFEPSFNAREVPELLAETKRLKKRFLYDLFRLGASTDDPEAQSVQALALGADQLPPDRIVSFSEEPDITGCSFDPTHLSCLHMLRRR